MANASQVLVFSITCDGNRLSVHSSVAGRPFFGDLRHYWAQLATEGKALPGDSVPLRSTSAPPTVWLVHFVNGQPAGPSPYACPGVDKTRECLLFLLPIRATGGYLADSEAFMKNQ